MRVTTTYQKNDSGDHGANLAHVITRLSLSDACHALHHTDDALSNDDESEQL
jgi:hypothetical protein